MTLVDYAHGMCRWSVCWQTVEDHPSASSEFRVGPSHHIRNWVDCIKQGTSDDRGLWESHHFWLDLAGHQCSSNEHEHGWSGRQCCRRHQSSITVFLHSFISARHRGHRRLMSAVNLCCLHPAFAWIAAMLCGGATLTLTGVFFIFSIVG